MGHDLSSPEASILHNLGVTGRRSWALQFWEGPRPLCHSPIQLTLTVSLLGTVLVLRENHRSQGPSQGDCEWTSMGQEARLSRVSIISAHCHRQTHPDSAFGNEPSPVPVLGGPKSGMGGAEDEHLIRPGQSQIRSFQIVFCINWGKSSPPQTVGWTLRGHLIQCTIHSQDSYTEGRMQPGGGGLHRHGSEHRS